MRSINGLLPLLFITTLITACKEAPQEDNQTSGHGNSKGSQATSVEMVERRHAQPVSVNYPETGVDVGWGWDSEEGIPQANVCIEYSIEEDKGQTKYMTMQEITDSSELMSSMNISAAASVKTVAYKASGSAKFAKSSKINSFNSNFVLNVSVDNGVRYATPLIPGSRGEIIDPETKKQLPDAGAIRLTSEALRLAKQRDLTKFLNHCGDAYVAALYGGARLTALITVGNSSKEEKKTASTSFSGSGWGANVKASASGASTAKVASSRVSMRFYQSGGRKDEIPISKEDLLGKLKTITTEASDFSAYYRLTLMPYTALSNWPDRVIELDLSEQDLLADLWAKYATLYEDIEYILQNPQRFQALSKEGTYAAVDYSRIEALKVVQDQVHKTLLLLRDEAVQCSVPEAPCGFSLADYLSPYAYRIELPIPIDTNSDNENCPCSIVSPEKDSDKNIAALVDYYIREPVKNSCKNNPVARDCLGNAEIDRWLKRVGKESIALPDGQSAEKLIALAKEKKTEFDWLDVIDGPPHAWVDPTKIPEGQSALDTLLELLKN
ncbi:MAG: hypothetical protein N0E44_05535 [Candidatus Thiodiazotropha lotti]|nr:hypothetical protein [Candidatus Thiodiazotropha lotti]MCW4219340.1 hypothetical protein [Candidatus Thiodiazotropha lotti]